VREGSPCLGKPPACMLRAGGVLLHAGRSTKYKPRAAGSPLVGNATRVVADMSTCDLVPPPHNWFEQHGWASKHVVCRVALCTAC